MSYWKFCVKRMMQYSAFSEYTYISLYFIVLCSCYGARAINIIAR